MPSDRDPALDEVAQQVAVVARDLDHAAAGIEAQPLDHRVGEPSGVLDPGVGEGREVRVLAEDLVGRHVLRQLDQQAAVADPDVERVERLHVVELGGRQEPLAQGRRAEVHERRRQDLAAQPTARPRRPGADVRIVDRTFHRPECIRLGDPARIGLSVSAMVPASNDWYRYDQLM